jgi:histone deacetylase 6
MEEGSIVVSTELNGDSAPDTVDPSEVFGDSQSLGFRSKLDKLPLHLNSKASSLSRTNSTGQLNSTSTSRDARSPDKMDFTMSTPNRRTMPEVRIPPKRTSTVLPYATSRTGLVYDARMRFHAELPNMSISADDIHPEDPRRIHAIFDEIRQAGLVGSSSAPEDEPNENHCWRISPRHATRPEILLIHTEEHYDFVESLQGVCSGQATSENVD